MRIKKAIAKFIGRERVVRVATVSPEGQPHVVPVCHLLLDDKLYFASDTDARKVRNLKANPRVTVTVDLYTEDWSNLKGAMIQGTTKLIARNARFRRLRTLLYEKYPQYPEEASLDAKGTVIVEVTPTNIFSWGFE
jgi:PPOX class probable F420-dependent enzyme